MEHIFCIRQILEKKWEYNEAVYQLLIDFKKAYDSVRREVLYEGDLNENLKSAIKIQNTARLSCKLKIMILMV
jgi:hypothetical protein